MKLVKNSNRCQHLNVNYIIGIDEVGRGPIAGPVAVGAFVLLKPASILNHFRGVKDSKQLSKAQREYWFEIISEAKKQKFIDYYVTFRSEKIIDKKGISYAIKSALIKSLGMLLSRNKIKISNVMVLLDGGLKAPLEYKNQKTIIKGDEKEMIIALASICAKVLRDRKLIQLGEKYKEYGFEAHKGYGTKKHYDAIKRYGILSTHRRSFLKNLGI